MKPTGRVQQGKHNPSKEKRKANKKHRKDELEIDNEILDLKRTDSVCDDNVRNRVSASANPVVDSSPIIPAHVKVEAERPREPSWFLKQQAMTPGRSYLKKKDSKED